MAIQNKPAQWTAAEVKEELLKKYPPKVARKRSHSIVVNEGEAEAPEIQANVRTIPGIITMFLLHQWIKNEPVDLLISNTYGKYIARDEDIPFLRFGFPILDRVGHQYFPNVGYKGGLRLLERILGLLLDRKDRDDPETTFELTL